MPSLNTDRLARDLHAVMQDVEDLLRATAENTNEKVAGTRARVAASLRSAKESIASMQARVRAQIEDAAAGADHYVHENPWRVIGAALGIGLLIGLVTGRRRH